jgi:hypothetical protein
MLSTQLAKDTFYLALQSRIAAGNPARTVVVRGQTRPGVVVAENELPGAAVDGIAPPDAFTLRWTGLRIDTQAAMPLLALTCEIRYATAGTPGLGGMDRGRSLAAMDAELVNAVSTSPQNAPAVALAEIAGGGASTQTPTGTNVFWSDASFAPAVMNGERIERTAQIEVYSYGE